MRPRAIRAESQSAACTRPRAFLPPASSACRDGASFFVRVMNLPAPRLVFRMLGKKRRRPRHNLHEKIHAHGKIRRRHTSPVLAPTASRIGASCSNQPVVPTRNSLPAPPSAARFSAAAAGVVNSIATSTPRKVSRVIPAPPAIVRNVAEFRAHLKSVFRRKLLDQLPHLPIPHDGHPVCSCARSAPVAMEVVACTIRA